MENQIMTRPEIDKQAVINAILSEKVYGV